MKFFAFFLSALAFNAAYADHSKTPSVSNVPSTTNTQSTTSTPVASATKGNTLINDGDWEQLAPFQECSSTPLASRAWDATYVYNIDQTFEITQHVYAYDTKDQCEANGRPFLDISIIGEGGPFGLVRANELYTLQRFEFTNATFEVEGWRAAKLLNSDSGCPCNSWAVGDSSGNIERTMMSMCLGRCPLLETWFLPHYNAYDVTSSDIISMSKMTEDVGEDFFSAEIGTVIKSPDTPSVTPTTSMSPSTVSSGTPSNSPLGPYQTSWLQVSPRMKCEDPTDPRREEFNFYFAEHDGYDTGNLQTYGNITGYPSKNACYSDWRRIYTVRALGKGYCFIETANKEGYRSDQAYTLCSVRMNYLSFQGHRWRAVKRFNDMVSGCRMGDDPTSVGDWVHWRPYDFDGSIGGTEQEELITPGTCEMFDKWNHNLYFTVSQRDHFGHNNHVGHRNAKISDFSRDWITIDPEKTSVAYEPMGRLNTNAGDFGNNYNDQILS